MSCTVSALPGGLLFALVSSIAYGIKAERESRESLKETPEQIKSRINEQLKDSLNTSEEITKEQLKTVCKEYDTVFMDRDLLMKTLQEYGIQTLMINQNKVEADIENFHFDFYRENETQPFKLNITFEENCDETVILTDLNTEYGMNAQEETYIKIKERLAQKNLQIDEEEVLEDDSIVITVNLN